MEGVLICRNQPFSTITFAFSPFPTITLHFTLHFPTITFHTGIHYCSALTRVPYSLIIRRAEVGKARFDLYSLFVLKIKQSSNHSLTEEHI